MFDDWFDDFPFYADKGSKDIEKKLYGKHAGRVMKTDIKEKDDGFELVTHPMSLSYHRTEMPWEALLREAVRMGYLSHQSGTCGLHIHVSRDAFGDTYAHQEAAIARVLYFFEKHWEELLKFSRRTQRQLDQWAARYGYKEQPREILEHAKKGYHGGRYTCVNLQNTATVEFRIFRGTLKRNTLLASLELVDKIRAAVPDIALTTDIIVGFPGETEEDFEETMDVVRKVRYDSAFTFIYSKRTGTPAASMEEQVPEDVIKARFDRLLKEVQKISAEKAGALTGQTLPVLIEEQNEQDASLVTGRLSNNSVVHLPGTADMIGKILDVKLTECRGFYYLGERADGKGQTV